VQLLVQVQLLIKLTNPSNATAGTVEYIVTPTSTTGTCIELLTITVTVNPKPSVTNAATVYL
jgi:predicted secreted protein